MKQYFNDPQQEVMYTAAKDSVIVGGRGIDSCGMEFAQHAAYARFHYRICRCQLQACLD